MAQWRLTWPYCPLPHGPSRRPGPHTDIPFTLPLKLALQLRACHACLKRHGRRGSRQTNTAIEDSMSVSLRRRRPAPCTSRRAGRQASLTRRRSTLRPWTGRLRPSRPSRTCSQPPGAKTQNILYYFLSSLPPKHASHVVLLGLAFLCSFCMLHRVAHPRSSPASLGWQMPSSTMSLSAQQGACDCPGSPGRIRSVWPADRLQNAPQGEQPLRRALMRLVQTPRSPHSLYHSRRPREVQRRPMKVMAHQMAALSKPNPTRVDMPTLLHTTHRPDATRKKRKLQLSSRALVTPVHPQENTYKEGLTGFPVKYTAVHCPPTQTRKSQKVLACSFWGQQTSL